MKKYINVIKRNRNLIVFSSEEEFYSSFVEPNILQMNCSMIIEDSSYLFKRNEKDILSKGCKVKKITDISEIDVNELVKQICNEKTYVFIEKGTLYQIVHSLYDYLQAESYSKNCNEIGSKIPVNIVVKDSALLSFPEFDKLLCTCSVYNIGFQTNINEVNEFKATFKDKYETIFDNQDTMIFFSPLKEDAKQLLFEKMSPTIRSAEKEYKKIKTEKINNLKPKKIVVLVRDSKPIVCNKVNKFIQRFNT